MVTHEKACILIPTHFGREKIVVKCIDRLVKHFNKNLKKIVLVGDFDNYTDTNYKSKDWVEYVPFENMLSYKMNKGLEVCREFSPDAVMICGSDDWFSGNWLINGLQMLNNGSLFVGGQYSFAMDITKEPVDVYRIYLKLFGSGDIMSSTVLNKIDWTMYNKPLMRRLDSNRRKLLSKNGATRSEIENTIILTIKGDWEMITPVSVIRKTCKMTQLSEKAKDKFLKKYFKDYKEFI
jgi:hypothetical protein